MNTKRFNPIIPGRSLRSLSFFLACTIVIFISSGANTNAQTCPTTSDYSTKSNAGSWTNSGDWASGRPPYPLSSGAYTIPAGEVILINSSNFSLNSSLHVRGTLVLDGKLNLADGTEVTVAEGGLVCCSGNCNPSDRLTIGGNTVWNGHDPAVSGPAWSDGSQPLPISLLFFSSKADKDFIQLFWATVTENNSGYFVIEKSSDGRSYHEIGKVEAAGYSALQKNYSFNDNNPFIGRAYYRLRAVDLDGTSEYFNPVVADFAGKKGIAVYPNPLQDGHLNISLNFTNDQPAFAVITDMSGLELYSLDFRGSVFNIPLNLSSGTYLIKVRAENEVYVSRFVVK